LAGAAILAYAPLEVSVPFCLDLADTIHPQPDLVEIYNESYQRYERIGKKYFS
jgi:sugar (pentulose or hexulose) kinase